MTWQAWWRRWVPGVDSFSVGDEVLGFSETRSSQAEFVVVPANQLTPKPAALSWDVAGGLYVAGTTAYAAVRAVELTENDVVAVAGAAGGVGFGRRAARKTRRRRGDRHRRAVGTTNGSPRTA